MFLHMSVILSGGRFSIWCHFLSGCLVPCSFQGVTAKWGFSVKGDADPRPLKRVIRILLECILVMFRCLPWNHANLFFVHGYKICSSSRHIFYNNEIDMLQSKINCLAVGFSFRNEINFYWQIIKSIWMYFFSTYLVRRKTEESKKCRLYYINMVFKYRFVFLSFRWKMLVKICYSSGANCSLTVKSIHPELFWILNTRIIRRSHNT